MRSSIVALVAAVVALGACDDSGGSSDGPPGPDLSATVPPDLARPHDLKGQPPPPDLATGMPGPPDMARVGNNCTSDAQCGTKICLNGLCVPGCDANPSLCSGAEVCQPNHHCALTAGGCGNDMDCGPMEYCTFAGSCQPLPTPGTVSCTSGTSVSSTCNMATTASQLASCAGPAGPSSCPYCRDNSCYWPLSWKGPPCRQDSDCHANDYCNGGLCTVKPGNPCPKFVLATDVFAGVYGSGKEVCMKEYVVAVVNEADGDFHVRVNASIMNIDMGKAFKGLVTEPTPQYVGQGALKVAPEGQVAILHGMVRWDQGHGWWEVHPVDLFQ